MDMREGGGDGGTVLRERREGGVGWIELLRGWGGVRLVGCGE